MSCWRIMQAILERTILLKPGMWEKIVDVVQDASLSHLCHFAVWEMTARENPCAFDQKLPFWWFYAELDHIPEKRNPYVDLISDQVFALISSLDLDSGHVLEKCEVAYKTWGVLNEKRDNVLVVCHALSGSSDLEDWWGPLLGPGKAFDYTRYLVFCGNLLGSPYGSASPLTINPSTGRPYGPEFPETSIRDDVR